MKIQLKRSSALEGGHAKEPTADAMEYGELAVNFNAADPKIFIKDSGNNIIEIATKDATEGGTLWSSSGSKLYPTNIQSSIGIGTDSPDAPLTIKDDSLAEIRLIRTNSSNNYSSIAAAGTTGEQLILDANRGKAADGLIDFKIGDTTFARINSAGNFGIKNTSPTVELDVTGSGKFSQKVTSATTVAGDSGSTLTTKNYVENLVSGGITAAEIWVQSGGKVYPKELSYDVGIGKSTPNYKLDVNGDAGVSGNLLVGGKVGSSSTSSGDPNTTLATKDYVDSTVSGSAYWSAAGANGIYTSKTAVGIGVTSPIVALDVAGSGAFTGKVTCDTATTSGSSSDTLTTKGFVDSSFDTLKTHVDVNDAALTGQINNLTSIVNGIPNYWNRSGSTLTPATSSDIVQVNVIKANDYAINDLQSI